MLLINLRRLQITMAISMAVVFCNSAFLQAESSKRARILNVREKVFSSDDVIKLKDLSKNAKILTKTEQELVVMETPVDRNFTYKIIDIAYMLQKYKQLHDVKLRGPREIVFQKLQSKEFLYKAQEAVTKYIKSNDPWKDWETDLLFSSDDELRILKVGEFDSVDVVPYDNKSMVGTLGFRLTFLNAEKKPVAKEIINPVILKKVDVVVVNTTANTGHILQKNDLKTVPLWIGDQKKNYVTDPEKCIGKELAKKMTYGDILRESDILNPMCVKRGDVIWVECISGALSVRVVATALQNGREGDYIRVKNPSTQKEFMVELTGPKKASYHTKS